MGQFGSGWESHSELNSGCIVPQSNLLGGEGGDLPLPKTDLGARTHSPLQCDGWGFLRALFLI